MSTWQRLGGSGPKRIKIFFGSPAVDLFGLSVGLFSGSIFFDLGSLISHIWLIFLGLFLRVFPQGFPELFLCFILLREPESSCSGNLAAYRWWGPTHILACGPGGRFCFFLKSFVFFSWESGSSSLGNLASVWVVGPNAKIFKNIRKQKRTVDSREPGSSLWATWWR